MKRREALKILPLSIAGMGMVPKNAGAFARTPAPTEMPAGSQTLKASLTAEIKPHNGAPTLFLNGRPTFAAIYWVAAPEKDSWDFAEQARRNADAGIHIYAFDPHPRLSGRNRPHRRMGQGRIVDVLALRRLQRADAAAFPRLAPLEIPG